MSGILIRCDGGLSVGLGHVIRCIALAVALRERGARVCFAMRDAVAHAADLVVAAGFPVFAMPTASLDDESAPLGQEDLQSVVAAARRFQASVIVVDHCGADGRYFGGIKTRRLILAVIDDLELRDLRSADWLLNQNLWASTPTGKCAGIRLAGAQFALLRPEFATAREDLHRPATKRDERVLVTLGGGDTIGPVGRILSALEAAGRSLQVRCILPSQESQKLARRAANGVRVTIHTGVAELVSAMRWADLSISAGGSTCWELMCLGVPLIVLPLSPDQERNAHAIESAGCGRRIAAEQVIELGETVKLLLGDPAQRARMSARGLELVDGRGAGRAADSLLGLLSLSNEERRRGVG
jgi:UDP-2,4-diacetamido-2,4,6-trideoxy-beta-L-altropyranose hydrolase